jgi:hypothetical protein
MARKFGNSQAPVAQLDPGGHVSALRGSSEPLFQRLFKYRQRELHTPLENFVTEAFGHVLGIMPRAASIKLVCDLLLPNDDARANWRAYTTGKRLAWLTQYRCEFGIIDMVLEADRKPILAIENKIGAGFGATQLTHYEEFLRWPSGAQFSALAVITHTSNIPTGFVDRNAIQAPGESWRHACSWADVWRWLKAEIGSVDDTRATLNDAPWTVFAQEFINFLEEHDMSSSTATQLDFAAATLFLDRRNASKACFMNSPKKSEVSRA